MDEDAQCKFSAAGGAHHLYEVCMSSTQRSPPFVLRDQDLPASGDVTETDIQSWNIFTFQPQEVEVYMPHLKLKRSYSLMKIIKSKYIPYLVMVYEFRFFLNGCCRLPFAPCQFVVLFIVSYFCLDITSHLSPRNHVNLCTVSMFTARMCWNKPLLCV